ncbi:LysR family transcriptional regulator [Longispora albida]|uniref:LysR family transcriptional regulator n=1 Tax=Longispora albida TaxID=203523 RepID=UPI000368B730|nr:LysR substrate-binding domain-containing protein [Longispora albida]
MEVFLVLAEELHFGRTAERLRISAARVSQTISKQERQIGAPLFERTSRKVTLTPIGQQFLAELRPAYEELRRVVETTVAVARGHEGTLTLGIMGAMGHEIFPILDLFRARHPACALQLREAHFSDPFGPLRSGQVDVQLTWGPVREPDLAVGPEVYTESSVLAVPDGHPLAARQSVSLEDLAGYPVMAVPSQAPEYWIDAISPFRTPSGRPIARDTTVVTFQEVLTLVAAGVSITPVHAHAVKYYQRPGIVFVPIHDAQPCSWYLIWRAAGETTLVRAFAQAARDATG